MIYSQSTQQDIRKVLSNTTTIQSFQKAYYLKGNNSLPPFEEIYYQIVTDKVHSEHPWYKIVSDPKVKWELFRDELKKFTYGTMKYYDRFELFTISLQGKAAEHELKAVLPLLLRESTKLAAMSRSLKVRLNHYKLAIAQPEKKKMPALSEQA